MDERIFAVLQAVATMESCVCDRPDDLMWCPFPTCDASIDYPQVGAALRHGDACPVTVARTLLREMGGDRA